MNKMFFLGVLSLLASNANAKTYQQTKAQIAKERRDVAEALTVAKGYSLTQYRAKAVTLFEDAVYRRLIPFWYGTPWEFTGQTDTPRQGTVACGVFVSTVLRDAGVNLSRVQMSIIASERMIRSLVSPSNIRYFHKQPINQVVKKIRDWGPGVYVVGLDFHTGFIINRGGKVLFIHSSYVDPPLAVVKEVALHSDVLASSKYKVLGKLSADWGFLNKWLTGKRIPVTEWNWN